MSRCRVKSLLATTAMFAALLAPVAARAEFATTDVQVLHGWSFDDNLLGYDSISGEMTTVTLEHFSTWAYGDNFMFADGYRLNAKNGYHSDLYGEWHPRLFLNKLGLPTGGFIKNWGLAGEINQGRGFYAYLGGLGLDLDIPGFAVAGINFYYRRDSVDVGVQVKTSTWQISPFWTIPINLGPAALVFTGFVDVTTNHDSKLDIMAQPQLMIDVGSFAGSPGKLRVGTELYIHRYRNFVDDKDKTVFAPQALFQWVIL